MVIPYEMDPGRPRPSLVQPQRKEKVRYFATQIQKKRREDDGFGGFRKKMSFEMLGL